MAELKQAQQNTPARVSVEVEFLMNLGNFENAKVVIGLSDDVRPGEHVDDTLERLYSKADEELAKRAAALRESAGDL